MVLHPWAASEIPHHDDKGYSSLQLSSHSRKKQATPAGMAELPGAAAQLKISLNQSSKSIVRRRPNSLSNSAIHRSGWHENLQYSADRVPTATCSL